MVEKEGTKHRIRNGLGAIAILLVLLGFAYFKQGQPNLVVLGKETRREATLPEDTVKLDFSNAIIYDISEEIPKQKTECKIGKTHMEFDPISGVLLVTIGENPTFVYTGGIAEGPNLLLEDGQGGLIMFVIESPTTVYSIHGTTLIIFSNGDKCVKYEDLQ